ncbi:hypothetical protein DY000_02013301 [Brassica cretica]|uniref:Uncharacterized protein n=1 Tax=Brassica cretica TaxID=69181 RepID=A0ABQ7D317_BRACR|nr:hypothetical protein DY000_02013301 [Brassica cretica]
MGGTFDIDVLFVCSPQKTEKDPSLCIFSRVHDCSSSKVKIVDMSIFKDQYVEEREKFRGCVLIFEKPNGDGSQSVKMELSKRLIEERVGVKPYIADLLGGSFSSL